MEAFIYFCRDINWYQPNMSEKQVLSFNQYTFWFFPIHNTFYLYSLGGNQTSWTWISNRIRDKSTILLNKFMESWHQGKIWENKSNWKLWGASGLLVSKDYKVIFGLSPKKSLSSGTKCANYLFQLSLKTRSCLLAS